MVQSKSVKDDSLLFHAPMDCAPLPVLKFVFADEFVQYCHLSCYVKSGQVANQYRPSFQPSDTKSNIPFALTYSYL